MRQLLLLLFLSLICTSAYVSAQTPPDAGAQPGGTPSAGDQPPPPNGSAQPTPNGTQPGGVPPNGVPPNLFTAAKPSGAALWGPIALAIVIAFLGILYSMLAYKIPKFTLFLAGTAFTANVLSALYLTIVRGHGMVVVMVVLVVLSTVVGAGFVYMNTRVLFLGSLLTVSVLASQLRYILSFMFVPPNWLFLVLLILITPPCVYLGYRFPMLMLIVGSSLGGAAIAGHSIDFQYQLLHLSKHGHNPLKALIIWNTGFKRFIGLLMFFLISALGIWYQGKQVRNEKNKADNSVGVVGGNVKDEERGMGGYAKA